MTAKQIKAHIEKCVSLFGFEFQNKDGNVDPYYLPETKSTEYLLFFDGAEQTVHDIEDVMSTPFINGYSLNELAEKLIITEL